MINLSKVQKLLRLDIALFLLCVIFFLVWPQTDIAVASHYYSDNQFTYADNPFIRFIYLLFARIHILYLLIFIGAIIWCTKKGLIEYKKRWTYLLLALIIGPGILVNLIFKDNTLGRPRPQHIEMFGGEMTFTPVFYYSGECAKNCSFVSGHAAIGFFLMAAAWVRQRRIWLAYGILLGALVGFVRILQGGHFFSDVIFAGWFTYFTYALLAFLMKIPYPPPARKPSNS